mgnify:CR=1 FL=1
MMMGRSKFRSLALPALLAGSMGVGMPALGQSGETVSRAVVQPLPPAAADDLNGALLRLARDRRDVDALITAGLPIDFRSYQKTHTIGPDLADIREAMVEMLGLGTNAR